MTIQIKLKFVEPQNTEGVGKLLEEIAVLTNSEPHLTLKSTKIYRPRLERYEAPNEHSGCVYLLTNREINLDFDLVLSKRAHIPCTYFDAIEFHVPYGRHYKSDDERTALKIYADEIRGAALRVHNPKVEDFTEPAIISLTRNK